MVRSSVARGLAIATLAAVVATGASTAATATTTPVKAKATTLSIKASSGTVTAKGKYKDTVSGVLKSGKTLLAKEKVSLQERKVGTKSWTKSGTTKLTNSKGKVSYTVTQKNTKEQYRLVFAGTTKYKKATSATVVVTRK